MENLFIQTKETTEGTCLLFKDPLKQGQILLYQGDKIELDSIQNISDQYKKRNMFIIVIFLNSTTQRR